MRDFIFVYLRGILMGVADLIPGISGGTIAFITGIYSRFITALSNIGFDSLISLFKSFIRFDIKDFFKKLRDYEFDFLGILIFGIGTAIFIGALGVSYLLENFESYVLAFFIGTILSSSFFLYENIHNKGKDSVGLVILGVIIGLSLYFFPEIERIEPALYLLFIAGFIASLAMIIPGISGSFLLLIMGLYYTIIDYVSNFVDYLLEIIIFGLGMVIGVISLSKLLRNLLDKHKDKTFSILLGLVIGALLVPLSYIDFENSSIIYLILLFVFGFGFGYFLRFMKNL